MFLQTAFLCAMLALFAGSGCAVHYFDVENNTEHVLGFGHMAMKVGAPHEGLKAIARRVDLVGVGVGSLDRDVHFECGWGVRQRIEVVDENTAMWLAWPTGSFYNVRVGSKFPFDLEEKNDFQEGEESP